MISKKYRRLLVMELPMTVVLMKYGRLLVMELPMTVVLM